MEDLPGVVPVEEPVCRICFTGEDEGAEGGGSAGEGTVNNPLITPCGCTGSQKYVHLECLREWQRSVQVQHLRQQNARPGSSSREARHLQCSVCRESFAIAPVDGSVVMSDLAHVGVDDIAPGLLLVTSRSRASSTTQPQAPRVNLALRAYVEAKAAHFREAVYILTYVCRGESDVRDEDFVFGTNLTRMLEISDVSALEGAADEELIRDCAENGVEVRWMNGGPVRPRSVTGIVCLDHLCRGRIQELCFEYDLNELDLRQASPTDETGHGTASAAFAVSVVLCGELPGLLAAAVEEAAASATGFGSRGTSSRGSDAGQEPETRFPLVTVLAWAGMAQWTRSQLLGDMAKGCWGWCQASPEDLRNCAHSPEASKELWENLRYSDRLKWAPANEMWRRDERPAPSRSTSSTPSRSRFARAVAALRRPSTEQPHQPDDALDAFVRQFETLRRRGSGSSTQLQPFRPPSDDSEGSNARGRARPESMPPPRALSRTQGAQRTRRGVVRTCAQQ